MNKRVATGNPWWVWLSWSLLVIVFDQLSKIVIVSIFSHGQGQFVTSFFNLVRVHNTGAAFSFLAGAGGWQRWFFVALGLVAVTFMVWLMRSHPHQKLFCFALASILGGAIGNIIDRLWHGYVVDFLDFHWSWLAPLFHGGHFPAFNLADSAITLGAALLIWDEIRRVRRS